MWSSNLPSKLAAGTTPELVCKVRSERVRSGEKSRRLLNQNEKIGLRIQKQERANQLIGREQGGAAREGTYQIDQLLSSQHQKARDISPSGATTTSIKAIRTTSVT
jgi:hypothetical protein